MIINLLFNSIKCFCGSGILRYYIDIFSYEKDFVLYMDNY